MRRIKDTVYENKIEIFLFFLTIMLFWLYGAFEFPILRDHGLYSYVSQELLRGYPIYSTPDIKGPFLYMNNAFWTFIFGFLPNWMALRAGMLLIGGLITVCFYKLVLRIFKGRLIPFFSSLVLISFTFYSEYLIIGDPKALSLLFILSGMLFLFKRRYFISGLLFGLCPFIWQPTGIFLLAPVVYILLEGFERKKIISTFSGVVTTASLIIAYFIFTNTTPNLLEFMILLPMEYKRTVYFSDSLMVLFNILASYNTEILFLIIGILGVVYYSLKGIKGVKDRGLIYLRKNKMMFSLIIPFILFSIYLFADIQIGDDIIVHLSLISLVNGYFFTKIFYKLSYGLKNFIRPLNYSKITSFMIITLLIGIYGFFPAFQPVYPENYILTYGKGLGVPTSEIPARVIDRYGYMESILTFLTYRTGEQNTIHDQVRLAEYIDNNMKEEDKILSLASPEILFLSGQRNMNKYPLIESDVFQLHLSKTSSLEEFRNKIMEEKPKYIIYEMDYILDVLNIRDYVYKNYNRIEDVKYFVYERK